MVSRITPLALFTLFVVALSSACGGSSPSSSSDLSSRDEALTAPPAGSSVPSLGTAANFAILAGAAATCTDATINGNVGVAAGASTFTQTRCTVNGNVQANATGALADFNTAYTNFQKNVACNQHFTVATLGNHTFAPGVYCFDAALTATDAVWTLDGPANATWIFKIGTGATDSGNTPPTGALTGTGFSVVMKDGSAPPCNSVYWWVAEAVTMTDSHFAGIVLAGAAITMTGGTFTGDAFAKAAVTITGPSAVIGCGAGNTSGNPPPICQDKDFVTGGGWIRGTKPGAKDTFSVAGGTKHGAPRGHLTYEDHGTGMKVKGTGVTAYTALDATTRRIEGTAKVNGNPGYAYQVHVSDQGEPGRNDTFAIRITKGTFEYKASGKLDGGNIQLHTGRNRAGMCKGNGEGDDDDDDERDDDHGDGDDHGDDDHDGHGGHDGHDDDGHRGDKEGRGR